MISMAWCKMAVLGTAGVALLALIWWGWQQGGLALMQLGMAIC